MRALTLVATLPLPSKPVQFVLAQSPCYRLVIFTVRKAEG